MKKSSVAEVYQRIKCRIPLSTLYRWKTKPETKQDGKQKEKEKERNSPYKNVAKELFEYFLVARARKVGIDDEWLKEKTKQIAKKIQLPNFKAING